MANQSRERWDEAVCEHAQMLDALEARDGTRLSRLLSEHLQHKLQTVKKAMAVKSQS